MCDEDVSSDVIEESYGSMRIQPTIPKGKQTIVAKSVVKSGQAATVTTLTTRKQKYGPPLELRLKKTNKCIIISNRFENDPARKLPQNKIDEENIERTFSWLNFDVERHINLDSVETKDVINELCREDHTDEECIVCFFITHGNTDQKLYANNMVSFSLDDDVIQKLINCQSLQGKEKLVFVQACRGGKRMEAVEEVDGSGMTTANIKKKKAKYADTFVYFATTEGHLAWGNNDVGSYFIHTLCGVLQEYGGDYHLGDVVTKVNEVLATRVRHNNGWNCDVVEVGDIHHTLTRKLYFNPHGTFPEDLEEKGKYETKSDDRSRRTIVKITNTK